MYQTIKGENKEHVELLANFCELTSANPVDHARIYQYHVDFEPDIESRKVKQALFYKNPGIFATSRAFDGNMLYSTVRSEIDVCVSLFRITNH